MSADSSEARATAAKIAGIADEPVTLPDRGKQILQELCRVLRCDAMSIAVRDAERRMRNLRLDPRRP